MSDYSCRLLDAAKAVSGSDYKTAKALNVSTQQISNWRALRAPIPVADVVLLAELAGMHAEEWAARAIVHKYEGTEKGIKLARALGKYSPAIGAALASFGVSAAPIFSRGEKWPFWDFIQCILCKVQITYRSKI